MVIRAAAQPPDPVPPSKLFDGMKLDTAPGDDFFAAGSNPSPEGQKVAAFFEAYLDEATIEARGLAPLDEPLGWLSRRSDTVRNLDAGYDAFSPKPGQALFLTPQERVRVW